MARKSTQKSKQLALTRAQKRGRKGQALDVQPSKEKAKPDRLWFENGFWGSLKYVVEFAAIGVAVFATIYGFQIWREERNERAVERRLQAEEREAREDERIARAWALLTTAATGNSAKVEAIEFLHSKEIPLTGIDLSCERMNGGWDEEEMNCERPTYLEEVKLEEVILFNANLQGAGLFNADLQGAGLWQADLQGADLTDANFANAKKIEDANFTGAWAWSDQLPQGLSGVKIDVCEFQIEEDQHLKPETGCEPMVLP